MRQRKTEEQLKSDIFNLFARSSDESSSDRRQVYFGQIFDTIIPWCIDYLKIQADEMGEEIFKAVQRFVKGTNIKIPKDRSEFFRYLITTLRNAENEYNRKNEKSKIRIPRNDRKKLKNMNDVIAIKESNAGRKLTEIERSQCISEWFDISEYSKLINLINTGSLEFESNKTDDNERNHLNSKVKTLYMDDVSNDPIDEYFVKLDRQNIKDALELALKNTQKRSRECYRSLFTAYCINKSLLTEYLIPLLDNKILETYQENGEKPEQQEIYLKYHPTVQKESADASSSKMLKDFLGKLEIALRNPENFQ